MSLDDPRWAAEAADVLAFLERNPAIASVVKQAFRNKLTQDRVVDCLAYLRAAGRARPGRTDNVWRATHGKYADEP